MIVFISFSFQLINWSILIQNELFFIIIWLITNFQINSITSNKNNFFSKIVTNYFQNVWNDIYVDMLVSILIYIVKYKIFIDSRKEI